MAFNENTETGDVISVNIGGGLVNGSYTRSNDVEDEWIYDGDGRTEPTMDEIEESDNETSCCSPCNCYGCRQCLRRAASELSSLYVDVKQFTVDTLRRRYSRTSWTQWTRKRFPIIQWLPRYTLKHLRGDVVAGLTTGFSVIPQGLAYGQIVELAPQYGLYSAFMGSFVYAILGTGKDIAVGPSVVVSILAATYGTGNSPIRKDPTYAILLALFSGILQVAMGLLRLGFIFDFVSLPVLKAFRAAAGIVIFMSRIKKWWGLPGVPREFLPQLYWTLNRLPETNLYDLLLGGLCILLLFAFKKLKAYRWKRKFKELPLPLKIINRLFWILGAERNIIVVTFSSAVVYAMLKSGIPISHTDEIPQGIPVWRTPNFTFSIPETNVTIPFSEIAYDIGPGIFFIAIIGMMETISVGQAFGKKGNYKIDYNQELLAIGLSNILCSFVSGHPVTGAFLRSSINFNSGVKTPAAGILAACVVLVCLTVATPIMYYIPVCAMAATIMMGGIDVVTFHKLGVVWNTKRSDILSYLVTFIVSLTWGIQYGIFMGVGTDLLMLLCSTMKPAIKNNSHQMETGDSTVRVVSIHPNCGLLFPAAAKISNTISKHGNTTGVTTIVLDLSQIVDTDSTVVQALKNIHEQNQKKGIRVLLYNPQSRVDCMLSRTQLRSSIVKPSTHGSMSLDLQSVEQRAEPASGDQCLDLS